MCFGAWRHDLVTKAEVERYVRCDVPVILSKCGDEAVAQATAAARSETDILRQSKQEVCFCHADGSAAGDGWVAGEGAVEEELAGETGVADVKDVGAVVVVLEADVDVVLAVDDGYGVLSLNNGVVEQR
jgi:hypothetical protein